MKCKQKFKRGNLVKIAEDLGPYMQHFENDCNAIIIGSYADKYGDKYGENNVKLYTIMLECGRETSWYKEHQLSFIAEGGEHLIEKAVKKNGEVMKDSLTEELKCLKEKCTALYRAINIISEVCLVQPDLDELYSETLKEQNKCHS